MANTYTSLHYHFSFSTKNRQPWIAPEIERRIWEYLGGIARTNKLKPLKTGGIDDHVHLLLGAPPTMAPAKIAQLIKGGSSGWIHEESPDLAAFAWQDGYEAFTVSKSGIPDVTAYIENQREHHRERTYKEEFRALLERHGIEYGEVDGSRAFQGQENVSRGVVRVAERRLTGASARSESQDPPIPPRSTTSIVATRLGLLAGHPAVG